ncbi:class I SAM-dependent methyltransferase [Nocardioides anomalus]|uniref:Class I SAM-dependent methyltransferase n=1 Tax=Nocardioides anomalus TaxID=2712223 RepID=A0A6G6WCI7_9ACTN|nr:class I SAM-dependent methyltransferase [Nocardioides anomalus]QIG43061.1 class I SAM-dependent methyltransferase [Nocardioides anomalus]
MAGNDVPISDWLSADPSEPGAVAERYDAWAASYDDDLASWSYQAPVVVARTVRNRHPEAADVLDVGCGTGLVGRELRTQGYAGRLVGLDLSQASLDLAGEAGGYDALERTDLQRPLPVADDSADAAVCVGVMTYLPEVEAFWRELARVVRPGGLVVVTQREDLWHDRDCAGVVERLTADGLWHLEDLTGPAPYLPDGYGDGAAVPCYYLTART